MTTTGLTSPTTGKVLMTRRERREAEERARQEALAAAGSSGDTVVVGGISFYGPAPVSPPLGNPVVPANDVPALHTRNQTPARPAVDPQERARRAAQERAERVAAAEQAAYLEAVARAERAAEAERVARAQRAAAAEQAAAAERAAAAEAVRSTRSAPVPFAPVQQTATGPDSAAFPKVQSQAEAVATRRSQALRAFVEPAPVPLFPTAGIYVQTLAAPAPGVLPDLRSRAERAGRPESGETPVATAPVKRGGWLPRLCVLGTLAAATIAAPLAPGGAAGRAGASPFDLDLAKTGPSTLDVVAAPVKVPAVSAGITAAVEAERAAVVASRSDDRDPIPGCDADKAISSSNGHLADSELCDLPFAPGYSLQPRAAVALTALNEAFRAEFGFDIALVDSYRSLSEQYAVKKTRGYLAAKPGTSMHGYGLAIDLDGSITGNAAAYKWLRANGAAYGWENPPWARRGGSGNYEPWHFEFRPGVEQVSTWH